MFGLSRLGGAVFARFANRKAVFTIAAASVIGAKLSHIYAHMAALPQTDILRWGLSFFMQDAILLLTLRFLLDGQIFGKSRALQIICASIAFLVTLFVVTLASIDISFFITAGSELSWRNAGLASDSSSWSTLLTGLFSCSLVFFGILVISWIIQDLCYGVAGLALDLIKWPVVWASSFCCGRHQPRPQARYSPVQQNEEEVGVPSGCKEEEDYTDTASEDSQPTSRMLIAMYVLVGLMLTALIMASALRPEESSLVFMSWTLPLLPFVSFSHSAPALSGLLPLYSSGINWNWDNQTALGPPVSFPWLPEEPLAGFEDWYRDEEHYRADLDPLKISNMEDKLLSGLRNKLEGVNIKHVMLVKLESTRKDVFPLKKSGVIWDKVINTFEDKNMSAEAFDRLATLTPTANYITGDYEDGFDHVMQPRRGGISANNDFTTSTYTLKSMAGTWCGLSGVVADFNEESEAHIYQPCLPHIFEAMNKLNYSKTANPGPKYTEQKWKSIFMQSVTLTYDRQDLLMPAMGYRVEDAIGKEYLVSDHAKFPNVTVPDINYYGMPEDVLEKYLGDVFDTAKANNERLFLGHLTSTSHHPFEMPKNETFVPVTGEGKMDDLSHYLNAIGYVDRWLAKILNILEEKGVANETLVVFVGDHGLSVAETGGITPYMAPNIGNFKVPLVFSHPALPVIDIDEPTVSLQVLPTILDLLVETGSMSVEQSEAARDMIRNYEGQSLLRPLHQVSPKTGEPDWQFTVMNPGRATISIRDPTHPHLRIVAPIVEDEEWRFTDLSKDPQEQKPLRSFGFHKFLELIKEQYGKESAEWSEKAGFMCRWWVEENARRWRYTPPDDEKKE